MKLYLPDHRTVEVDKEEYQISRMIFGNRAILLGVHDSDPIKPYISKRTKTRENDPMVQLEVIPLPVSKKARVKFWLLGAAFTLAFSLAASKVVF